MKPFFLLVCTLLGVSFLIGCNNPIESEQELDEFERLALELSNSPQNFSGNPIDLAPIQLNSIDEWEELLKLIGSKGRYVNLDISPSTGMTDFDNPVFPNGKEFVVSLVLPASSTSIVSATAILNPLAVPTFVGFVNLASIRGENVEILGNFTFSRIPLLNIDFPAVTAIGNSAFGSAPRLASIVLSETVESIGASAFNGCDNLTSVTITGNIPQSGFSTSAFNGNLRALYYGENGGPGTYTRTVNGTVWTKL